MVAVRQWLLLCVYSIFELLQHIATVQLFIVQGVVEAVMWS